MIDSLVVIFARVAPSRNSMVCPVEDAIEATEGFWIRLLLPCVFRKVP
jgi:hypothetical protein